MMGITLAMCDETWNSPVRMVNVNNLQNMGIVSSFQSQLLAPTGSIPHNPLIAGNYLCLSYYHDGIQIYDISNPSAPLHAAWYDTDLVATNYNGYKGAWGVYPYLPSGTILGSDILNGLFVLRAGFPFPHPLQGNFQVHHASCNGLSNGDATFVVQGGTQLPTGGYTYLWSNGATTATATGLPAGNYTVTATDRHGFTIVQSVQITQPTAILPNLSSIPESCPGNADGTLSVNPSGGASNFSYVWSTGDMIATLNGLTAGTYTCTITDGVGCQAVVSGTVGLVGPVPLAFAGQDTAICNTTYQLNAQAQSGAQAFWSPGTGSGQIANPNAAQTLVTGMSPGQNTFIWVVNGNPCANTDTISIYVSAASQVSAGPDTMVCGNSLQLLGSNPLMGTGTWSSNGPGVNFSDPNDPNAVAQGLTPGTYGLVWTVADMGCTRSDTQLVTVTPAVAAAYSFGGSGFVVNFSDNSVNATTWFWDFGDGATSSLQNPSHTYTQSGSFTACLIAGNVCGMDTLCRSLSIGSVGISPREAYQFTVFPNPSLGNIWLQPSMDCDNVVIRMVDMQGRQCLRQELGRIDAQGEAEIDLTGMAKGMYLLEIEHDGWNPTAGGIAVVM
jgi:PKD repeat protein